MKSITPFLWFDGDAEEAAKFYTSIFKDSKIIDAGRSEGDDPKSAVMSVTFRLAGHEYIAFNGGPAFKFTPAFSLFVDCKDQKEVDFLWDKLSKGGQKSRCGWLKDKFGVSWQIIPSVLSKMLQDDDPEKVGRVVTAMLRMRKIDVHALQKAYKGA